MFFWKPKKNDFGILLYLFTLQLWKPKWFEFNGFPSWYYPWIFWRAQRIKLPGCFRFLQPLWETYQVSKHLLRILLTNQAGAHGAGGNQDWSRLKNDKSRWNSRKQSTWCWSPCHWVGKHTNITRMKNQSGFYWLLYWCLFWTTRVFLLIFRIELPLIRDCSRSNQNQYESMILNIANQ